MCCSYNGSRYISDCLAALERDYPDYEVIVIDDGSTDTTAEIAARFDVQLVSTPNQGLSAARNGGSRVRPARCRRVHRRRRLSRPGLAALPRVDVHDERDPGGGGPNLPLLAMVAPRSSSALAPGGPNHVLRSDTEAEHVPGCNSSYRTDALRAVGGYDTRFRTAGDDVDVGWRMQERRGTIGFSAGAMVWHHRRGTARGYLRQQRGYGYAEALLERKWPSR